MANVAFGVDIEKLFHVEHHNSNLNDSKIEKSNVKSLESTKSSTILTPLEKYKAKLSNNQAKTNNELLLSDINSPFMNNSSDLFSWKNSQVGNGDLFGALVRRRIDVEAKSYNSPSFFNLSIPKINDNDIAPELSINNYLRDNLDSNKSKYKSQNQCNNNENNNKLIKEIPTKLKLGKHKYFSMKSKIEFTNILFPKLQNSLFSELDLVTLSLCAMRGIPSEIYTIDSGCNSSSIPYVILPGRSPTSVRNFILLFREYFIMRYLLRNAYESFINLSKEPAQLSLGAALGELLYLLDISIMTIEKKMKTSLDGLDNASLNGLWSSTSTHRATLRLITSIIAPDILISKSNESESESDLQYLSIESFPIINNDIIEKYSDSLSWLVIDNYGWNLFNKLYDRLNHQRSISWKLNRSSIFFNSLSNCNDISESIINIDDLSSSFSNLMICTFFLTRISMPLLRSLQRTLFNMNPVSNETVTENEIQSTLSISANALWNMYDDDNDNNSMISYIFSTTIWSRGRIELLDISPSNQEQSKNTTRYIEKNSNNLNVYEICRDLITNLKIPTLESDHKELMIAIDLALQRYNVIRLLVVSAIEMWISLRRSSCTYDNSKDLIKNNISMYTPTKNAEILDKDEVILIDDKDINRTEKSDKKKQLIATEKAKLKNKSLHSLDIIAPTNSVRIIDRTLLDETKSQILKRFNDSIQESELRRITSNWRRRRLGNNIRLKKALLVDLYQTELNIWTAEKLLNNQIINSPKEPSKISSKKIVMKEIIGPNDSVHEIEGAGSIHEEKYLHSTKVTQSPGGHSTLDLGDGLDEKVTSNKVGKKQGVHSINYVDVTRTLNFDNVIEDSIQDLPSIPKENNQIVKEIFAGDECNDKSNLLEIGYQIVRPSTENIKLEEEKNENLPTLMHSLWVLGESNGLIEVDSINFIEVNGVITEDVSSYCNQMQTLSPLLPVVKNSIGKLLKIQCQVIDLAVLYSSIRRVNLFDHIDNIDDIFLLSSRSDFLFNFCSNMVENHIKNFPIVSKSKQVTNNYHKNSLKYPNSNFWNEKSVQYSFNQACVNKEFTENGIIMVKNNKLKNSYADNNESLSWESLFSNNGLNDIEINYNSPWPLNVVFTKSILDSISITTRRLLELSHLSNLIRLLWKDLRTFRIAKNNLNIKYIGIERELFSSFRLIKQTNQSIFDFTSDRIRINQIHFTNNIINFSMDGFGGILSLFENYSNKLSSSLFIENNNINNNNNNNNNNRMSIINNNICKWISNIFKESRQCLKTLMKISVELNLIDNDSERDDINNNYIEQYIDQFRNDVIELKQSRQSLVESLCSIDKSFEIENSQTLLMYFGYLNK
jgi:aspartate carbamoyltransferase regulatory subunit